MTEQRFDIPAGFTPATVEPTGKWEDRYEVLYVPYEKQTHFEIGTARHSAAANPKYRWKTVDGDNVGDSGRTVLAWRSISDALAIVRHAVPETAVAEPTNRKHYDETIALLAKHHLELLEESPEDARPSGIDLTSRLFQVPVEQIERDYLALAAMRMAQAD